MIMANGDAGHLLHVGTTTTQKGGGRCFINPLLSQFFD